MQSQNTLNQLSRRKWLRDAAIAATGAVVVPSMLIGCTDHVEPGKGLLGDPAPITEGELRSAAQNLKNMSAWLTHLHTLQTDYEGDMFDLLKSGGIPQPSGWAGFIINILLDIAAGIITAAAEAVTAGAAIAGLAIASELIKKFAFPENRIPHNLDGEYAVFKTGQDKLYDAITDTLLIMADEKDNYENLRKAWPGDIDFNGKKYTLRDLANADFPSDSNGTAYVALKDAALLQFKKYFWNVMFIKAGSMSNSDDWVEHMFEDNGNAVPPVLRARENFYSKDYNKSRYVRGYTYKSFFGPYRYDFVCYWFTFDGRELSPAAATELFKDDTPGNIITSTGLFNRDYVFKQFHREKPNLGYHDMRKDLGWGNSPYGDSCYGFDCPDDFVFTGGDFPQLIKK